MDARTLAPTAVAAAAVEPAPAGDRWVATASPIGELVLTGTAAGVLTGCWFPGLVRGRDPRAGLVRDDEAFVDAVQQLDEYFDGARQHFDLRLAPAGTAFQLAVWDELRQIPYGETRSYGQLAARLARPGASRAVGLANGRNPLSVIVPCHRVIGADGTLTGYAGGMDRKRYLLDLEAGVRPLA